MDIILLIKSIMGLVVILGLLLFFLFFSFTKKKKKDAKEKKAVKTLNKKRPNTDLNHLHSIVKNKASTTKELKEALELVIKYHGIIHPKLGTRTHPDFNIYDNILFRMCRHPNIDKDTILNFDKSLSKLNPNYKENINDAITKGLNSRRV